MAKVLIVSRQDVFSREPTKVGQKERVTVWRFVDDPLSSFTVTLPVEGWTEAKEEAAVKAAATQVRLAKPKEIDV